MGSLGIRRGAAFAVLVAGMAALAAVLASGREDYTVHVRFENASQLVKGNRVQIAGQPVGTVESIEITREWLADVTIRIDEDAAPLRKGTEAVVRGPGLSSIAGRYIDLRPPPGSEQRTIPDGGVLDQRTTSSAVELDAVFSALGPRERRGLTKFIRGNADTFRGRSEELDAGLRYLPTSFSANGRLFAELTRDRPALERFLLDSSRLATDVADRRDDLSGLVDQLADFTGALARRRADLGTSLQLLPEFLRRANTTFVDLRSFVDELDPVIRDSAPAARRLGPLLDELRPFAREARPTLRDLSAIIRAPGARNDLVELTRSNVPLRDILLGPVERNGEQARRRDPVGLGGAARNHARGRLPQGLLAATWSAGSTTSATPGSTTPSAARAGRPSTPPRSRS